MKPTVEPVPVLQHGLTGQHANVPRRLAVSFSPVALPVLSSPLLSCPPLSCPPLPSSLPSSFRFRIRLPGLFGDKTDAEYGQHLIDRFILVHLNKEDHEGKFNLLLLMLRKLYMFASGACCFDNPDSAMNQELLLPGHLYGMIIKERLTETLRGISAQIARDIRTMERNANGRLGRDVTLATILEGDVTYMNKVS